MTETTAEPTIEHAGPPRRVARPLSLSLVTSAGIVALNTLTGVLLARYLGPTDRGALAAVYLWPLVFATVGSLGVAEAVTYHVARRTASLRTLIGTSVGLGLVLSVLLVGIGAAVLPLVLADYDAEARRAAYVFLLYVPINVVTLSLMAVLNGLQRFSSFHALRLLLIAATAAAMLALAVSGALTVTTAIAAYLLASVVWIVCAVILVARVEGSGARFEPDAARTLLGFGIRSHPGAVAGMLNEVLDKLLISVFLGPKPLGLYVIAVTLTGVTDLVGSSIGMVALPAVARLPPGRERTSAARRFVSVTLALSALASVPLIVFAPGVIRLFFGEDFLTAVDVTRVLLVAGAVLSTNRALAAVLRAANRPGDASKGQLVALLATVVALAALLPAFGIMGAGLASMFAYSVSMVSLVRSTGRALEIPAVSLLVPERHDVARALASLRRREGAPR